MTTLELYEKACELEAAKRPFALASVVHTTGSTPQKAGANALFEAAGQVWGTLGGGCMEAESRRRALTSLDNGKSLLFDLKLDEVTGWDDGLICGGKVRILVQPTPASVRDVFVEARKALEMRQRGLILTVLQHPNLPLGMSMWLPEGKIAATALVQNPQPLLDVLARGQATALRLEAEGHADFVEMFAEPIVPAPALIIAGAGHIGKALARQGALLGFEVTVVDDREAFANPENIPWAKRIVCGDIAESVHAMSLDTQCYVVIVTRGHRHDGAVLAACIHKPTAFIGMIGSKRKSLLIHQTLRDEGIADTEALAKVVSPVGLDIGAESVEEIALSIAAQLVAVRRTQSLTSAAMNISP